MSKSLSKQTLFKQQEMLLLHYLMWPASHQGNRMYMCVGTAWLTPIVNLANFGDTSLVIALLNSFYLNGLCILQGFVHKLKLWNHLVQRNKHV